MDEPTTTAVQVFPARAGMSPVWKIFSGEFVGVPRASGDEPRTKKEKKNDRTCSPRERG